MHVGTDLHLLPDKDVARIHAFSHHHYRDTRDLVTFQDGPLNRRRAPSFREKASVTVDAAELRDIENRRRKDLSVSRGNYHVGFCFGYLIECFIGPQRIRLEDLYSLLRCINLDRRRCKYLLSSDGLVGLAGAKDDVKAALNESPEIDHCKLRRSHEYDS